MSVETPRPRFTRLHCGRHRAARRRLTLGALTAIVVSAVAAISGCTVPPAVTGSGVAATETRADFGDFQRIKVSGAMNVTVEVVADAATEVEITGDDNVVPLVLTEVDGDQLSIRLDVDGWVRHSVPLTVQVKSSKLVEISASGASKIRATGITDSILVDTSGACRIDLAGSADAVTIDASGACSIDTSNLNAHQAKVDISGACSVHLRADQSLSGSASGACKVTLHGDCESASLDTSGVSSLKRVADSGGDAQPEAEDPEPPAESDSGTSEDGPSDPS